MTSTCFVTGANGFIGRSVCRHLIREGIKVWGLSRRKSSHLEQFGVQMVQGDLNSPETYRSTLEQCDSVIHLAGLARMGNGSEYETENVEGTRNLLNSIQKLSSNFHRLVLISSISAMDRAPRDSCDSPLNEDHPCYPTSDYGRSKLKAEQLVKESGLPFAILRPALVVGREMRVESHIAFFLRQVLQRGVIGRFDWPGCMSVIHVEDLTEGIFKILTHNQAEGQIFLAGGQALSLKQLFNLASPGEKRWDLDWLKHVASKTMVALPFKLKAMLFPALTLDDGKLRSLGWNPRFEGGQAIQEVLDRERQRTSPALPPSGRTLITGAASGLGRALAEHSAHHQRRLILVDRDAQGLESVLIDYPHVERIVCDLSDRNALNDLDQKLRTDSEPIDEGFLCAGFGLKGRFDMLSANSQISVIEVNVLARLFLSHLLLQGMLRRHFGRIVIISSSTAFQAMPFTSVYAASNAALLSLGEGISSEVLEEGVEVLTVCPGGMETRFHAQAGMQKGEGEVLMDPHEVAKEIFEAMALNRLTIFPSLRSKAMSLAARILPRAWSVRIWHHLMTKLR